MDFTLLLALTLAVLTKWVEGEGEEGDGGGGDSNDGQQRDLNKEKDKLVEDGGKAVEDFDTNKKYFGLGLPIFIGMIVCVVCLILCVASAIYYCLKGKKGPQPIHGAFLGTNQYPIASAVSKEEAPKEEVVLAQPHIV